MTDEELCKALRDEIASPYGVGNAIAREAANRIEALNLQVKLLEAGNKHYEEEIERLRKLVERSKVKIRAADQTVARRDMQIDYLRAKLKRAARW